MTDTTTIAEFVAKLGFQIEKGDQAKFNAALATMAGALEKVAATVAAVAASVVADVAVVAQSFDKLFFTAQRVGTTVAGLKELKYAFEQMGLSGETASSALENFAAALRFSPGMEGFLNTLGVKTRDANGAMRDMKSTFTDFIKILPSKGDLFNQAAIASRFGLDAGTVNALSRNAGELDKWQAEARGIYAQFGVNQNDLGSKSNMLMTAARRLLADLDALQQKITVELGPKLTELIEAISKWLVDHQDDIVQILDKFGKAISGVWEDLKSVAKALSPLTDQFSKLAKSLGDETGGLKWALEAVLAYTVSTWLGGMLDVFDKLGMRIPWWLRAYMGFSAATFYAVGAMPGRMGDAMASAAPGMGIPEAIEKSKDEKPVPADGGPIAWIARWLGLTGDKKGKGKTTGVPLRPELPFGVQPPPTPQIDPSKLSPNLTVVRAPNGVSAIVSKETAAQWEGFLKDMHANGMDPNALGGYNPRTVRGNPRLMSAHAYGAAIDWNDAAEATFKDPDKVREIAKKWGIRWGADFSNPDTGHFSLLPREGGRIFTPEQLKALSDKQSMLMSPRGYIGGDTNQYANLSARTNVTIMGSVDPATTGAMLQSTQNKQNSELIRATASAFS